MARTKKPRGDHTVHLKGERDADVADERCNHEGVEQTAYRALLGLGVGEVQVPRVC